MTIWPNLILFRQVVELEATLSETTKGRQVLHDAKAFLMKAVTDAGEFAAMARAAAKDDFHLSLP